jgi:hypothetical protein
MASGIYFRTTIIDEHAADISMPPTCSTVKSCALLIIPGISCGARLDEHTADRNVAC